MSNMNNISNNISDNVAGHMTSANLIKKIIYEFIQDEYKKYLLKNKCLIIDSDKLYNILNNLYEENIKILKSKIREQLKEANDISNVSIENLILEIFSEKEQNINNLKDEIILMQNHNMSELKIPVLNNSLNMSISIYESFIKINKVNIRNIENYDEIYNIINDYEYIYSINGIILQEIENESKIEKIKSIIKDTEEANIKLYFKKNK
jgi:hypothetical protein